MQTANGYSFDTKSNPQYKKTAWFKVVKTVAKAKNGLTKREILTKVGAPNPNADRNALFQGLRDNKLIRYNAKTGVWVAGQRAARII